MSEQSTPHIWQPWVRVPVSRHFQDTGGAVCSLQAFQWCCHLPAGPLVFPLAGTVFVGSDGKSQEPTGKDRAEVWSVYCLDWAVILPVSRFHLCMMSVKEAPLSVPPTGAFIRRVTHVWVQTDLSVFRLVLIPLRKVLAQFHPLSWFQIGRDIKQTHFTALFHIADLNNYKILLSCFHGLGFSHLPGVDCVADFSRFVLTQWQTATW